MPPHRTAPGQLPSAATLGKVCLVLAILFYLVAYLQRIRPMPLPAVADLEELQTLLQQWEKKADGVQAQGFAAVAKALQEAIQAQHDESLEALPTGPSGPSLPSEGDAASLRLLSLAGAQCSILPNTDLWGDVVVWGPTHKASSPAECCAACHAYNQAISRGGLERGRNSSTCNTWVHCSSKPGCREHFQECWLKHNDLKPAPRQPARGNSGPDIPWTSGVVFEVPDWQLVPLRKRTQLTMVTSLGPIGVQLLPELAPASVREIQRAVGLLMRGGHCRGCRIYRPEANFLVQGVIMDPGSYVSTPRHPNPPQKKMMERGLVCWAGGAGGPDWFVNLIHQSGFGDDHLCWGKVGEEDMKLVDSITRLPLKPKAKPNEMTFLAQEIPFNLTLA